MITQVNGTLLTNQPDSSAYQFPDAHITSAHKEESNVKGNTTSQSPSDAEVIKRIALMSITSSAAAPPTSMSSTSSFSSIANTTTATIASTTSTSSSSSSSSSTDFSNPPQPLQAVLDVKTIEENDGEVIRFYYLIGNEHLPDAEVRQLQRTFRSKGLEVLEINDDYRTKFNLSNSYQGCAVFVQKHLDDDKDYTGNTEKGFNVLETYNIIRQVASDVRLADDTRANMLRIVEQIQMLKYNALVFDFDWMEFQPQLEGTEEVLRIISEDINANSTLLKATSSSGANTTSSSSSSGYATVVTTTTSPNSSSSIASASNQKFEVDVAIKKM